LVYRAVKFSNGEESHHLLGFVPKKSGRVTSAIYNFDSYCDDAEYIWDRWKLMNSVVNDIDVTDSYVNQIKSLIM